MSALRGAPHGWEGRELFVQFFCVFLHEEAPNEPAASRMKIKDNLRILRREMM